MNGAQSLLRTLVTSDVDVCFSNPGTSEMHFVAALDQVPEMRGVLTLFEGVATGAADGYARVAGRPAATLLHLGPGLGNGLANLHNAKRAHTPLVNIVGDHATYHKRFDAPLESDIEGIARSVSGWYRVTMRPDDVSGDAADAIAAAYGTPGQVATLVLPADVSWSETASEQTTTRPVPLPPRTATANVERAAKAIRSGEPTALLIGGGAMRERGLVAASRVANACGIKLFGETFPANLERGAGLPPLERLGYFAEFMEMQLGDIRHLVIAGTQAPVSFFAYPGKASYLVPDGCDVVMLATIGDDVPAALEALADAVDAPLDGATIADAARPETPTGALSMETLAAAIGALLPEGTIVVDESNTSGLFAPGATAGAPRHDWLTLTGGAIGQGLPVATGAAVAAPAKRVLCLQADGSALYTAQALWSQAREGLDVTTLILANRSYAILNLELSRVGAEAGGPNAARMLDLTNPELDFVSLAWGFGVPATRATTAEELVDQLKVAVREPGPNLIEVIMPSM